MALDKIQEYYQKLPYFLRNRYAITAFVFAIWMLLFDQNDMFTQMKLRGDLDDLEAEKQYYTDQLETVKSDLDELMTNDRKLEKFAREKYFMKKPGEDIFIIVPEED